MNQDQIDALGGKSLPPDSKEPDSGAAARREAWLAAMLLRGRADWTARFVAMRRRLALMARPKRRWLMRRAAVTLTGAALLLSLARPLAPVRAATIVVDETICTLVDAIRAANTDTAVGGCAAGSGDDIIDLQTHVTLTTASGNYYGGDTGLPLVTSNITINGNGYALFRYGSPFRMLAVGATGDLTLNNMVVRDGTLLYGGNGAGAYVYKGTLRLQQSSNIRYCYTTDSGGGIFNNSGEVVIADSVIGPNFAGASGGGLAQTDGAGPSPNLTITGSRIEFAAAAGAGGGLYIAAGEANISDSIISDNDAFNDRGGNIHVDGAAAELTLTRTEVSEGFAETYGGGLDILNGVVTITDSTIRDNNIYYDGGGGINKDGGELTITGSTISGNESDNGSGGGIRNAGGPLDIVNSTISGNTADDYGGGLFVQGGAASLQNVTVSRNDAPTGGGIAADAGTTTLARNLISGNTAGTGDEVADNGGTFVADAFNVFGHAGQSDADAFAGGFAPGASDFNATTDGTPTALASILNTTLADNGGPTRTHALKPTSPALDIAPNADCAAAPVDGVDQRGAVRPWNEIGAVTGNDCDAGAVEQGSPIIDNIYVTTAAAGTTADSVSFTRRDILKWDGSNWSLFFDGGAFGLTTHQLTSADVVAPDNLYFSLSQNKIAVPGAGFVFGNDIVHFDGTDFDLYFDGSDVALSTSKEKVDAFAILPGTASPIGFGCKAYILISTNGSGQVAAFGGGTLRFRSNDILGFCATNVGPATAGFFHKVLDGNAKGVPGGAIISLSATPDGKTIFFTTNGNFNVPPAVGGHSSIYVYDQTNGTFTGPLWKAADNGLSVKVEGLHVETD